MKVNGNSLCNKCRGLLVRFLKNLRFPVWMICTLRCHVTLVLLIIVFSHRMLWSAISTGNISFLKHLLDIFYDCVLLIFFFVVVFPEEISVQFEKWKKTSIILVDRVTMEIEKKKCIYDGWIQFAFDNTLRKGDKICCSLEFALNSLFVVIARGPS